ncbi:hypothetical protein ACTXT7_015549 [Hymenolepis weldensis]
MAMPDPKLQEQPKISLKNLAEKSYITHHISRSCTNRFSTSFQELSESFNGTKADFKRRGRNEEAKSGQNFCYKLVQSGRLSSYKKRQHRQQTLQ